MSKVQNEMATKITINTIAAADSMRALKQAISANNNAWRAMAASMKAAGNAQGAAAEKVKGLTRSIEQQKQMIAELKSRQSGLDTTTQKGARQFIKLEDQIAKANRQLANYQGQLSKAKSVNDYYASGLAKLQNGYRLNQAASTAWVERLKTEGKAELEVNKAKLEGTRQSIRNLEKQQELQRRELNKTSAASGKLSEAFVKQKIRVDQTAASLAKLKTAENELNASIHPTKIQILSNHLTSLEGKLNKARNASLRFRSVIGANLISNAITSGVAMLQSQMSGIIKTGLQVEKTAEGIEARWKNIGVADQGVKRLMATMSDLKTNTNMSADAVNKLQSNFYGITGSVARTNQLTKGVGTLVDKLKLGPQAADAFALGLSRIENSGKVTSLSLTRLEKQAPGLHTALQKASGMSKKEFDNLLSSGKMTADQFNKILAKASKDYQKTSSAWGKTSGGSLHRLQENWEKTQAALAKPLIKVQATGLGELNKALQNKDTQKGVEQLGRAIAKLAVYGAKSIAVMARHQKAVKAFVAAIAGMVVFTKVTGGIAGFIKALGLADKAMNGIKAFDFAAHLTKVGTAFTKVASGAKFLVKGLKLVGVAMASNPFTIWVVAIGAVIAGFVALYKHNKKFKKFVDGIAKWSKKAVGDVIKWFKKLPGEIGKIFDKLKDAPKRGLKKMNKTISDSWKKTKKGTTSLWKDTQSKFSKGYKSLQKTSEKAHKGLNKLWDRSNKNISKVVRQMAKKNPQLFKRSYKVMQDYAKVWYDITHGKWRNLNKDIQNYTKDLAKFVPNLMKEMYQKLNDMTGGRLGDMVKTFQDKFNDIRDAVANAKEAVHERFVDLVRGIIAPFNKLLAGLSKGINWVLSKVGAGSIGTIHIPVPSYATGTPGTHPGGLAKVNDGPGAYYREMYRLPNGEIGMFPAVRNMIVPLPAGTSVLNADESHQFQMALKAIPHYADGIGAFFSHWSSKATDALKQVQDIMAHPIQFMQALFKRTVGAIAANNLVAREIVTKMPDWVASKAGNWVVEQFSKLADKFRKQAEDEDDDKSKKHHRKGSYAYGGLIGAHGLYELAEGDAPEYVIPTDINKRGIATHLLNEVNAKFGHAQNQSANASTVELEKKLDTVIDLLGGILSVNNSQLSAIKDQGVFDEKSQYKRQALKLSMINYQG